MRRSLPWSSLLLAFAALSASTGCGYKGAIYSSYQEAGLGIRTTAESDAPVKVHFGYDHSVAALVPRRGGDLTNEEATSLISKEAVGAGVNPVRAGTEPLLCMDSAFISGTAAIVASAPSGATVKVLPATAACPACPGAVAERGSITVTTEGNAGARIAAALTQRPGALTDAQVRLATMRELIDAMPPAKQGAVYKSAAAKMSPTFQSAYQQRLTQGLSTPLAFKLTTQDYLKNEPDDGPRREEVNQALATGLKEN